MSNRREFLTLATTTVGAGLLQAGCATKAQKPASTSLRPPDDGPGPGVTFSAHQYETLDAALNHLVPSGQDSPGARDVNAINYLDAAMSWADTDPDDPPLAQKATGIIDAEAQKTTGRFFKNLSETDQEHVFLALAKETRGRRVIRLLLRYALEAYLGDPVHGGNPEGRVWQAVGHRPGFPRPQRRGIAHIPEREP
jgi:gluconate 2-dehydrogenase gamma chain